MCANTEIKITRSNLKFIFVDKNTSIIIVYFNK